MKSFSIRLSVLALALAGFAASTVASRAASHRAATPTVVAMGTTPAAMCMPRDPSHCGMD